MDEINVAAVRHAAIQRAIGLHDFKLVPADLRDFQSVLFRESNDLAFENSKSGGARVELLAFFKQCLIANADTKERLAGFDEVARSL